MAGVKITDLEVLTAPVAADILYIVDVSDTSQSPQGTSKQITAENLIGQLPNIVSSVTGELVDNADPHNPIVKRPYLTWVGLVSQNGSGDPTFNEKENILGATITFARISAGKYSITSSVDIFVTGKVFFLATSGATANNDCFLGVIGVSANTINFFNYSIGSGYQDDFTDTSIEIRLY